MNWLVMVALMVVNWLLGLAIAAGGVILFGDCYREQIGYTMVESGLFAKDKVVVSKRFGEQKPEGFKNVAADLKLVCMVFQSFNTGRLDGRNWEIKSIFQAIKDARGQLLKRVD